MGGRREKVARRIDFFVLFFIATGLCGCATQSFAPVRVEAWERQYLAQYEMLIDPDRLDRALADHRYFSKEGSSGGASVGGCGCGCN